MACIASPHLRILLAYIFPSLVVFIVGAPTDYSHLFRWSLPVNMVSKMDSLSRLLPTLIQGDPEDSDSPTSNSSTDHTTSAVLDRADIDAILFPNMWDRSRDSESINVPASPRQLDAPSFPQNFERTMSTTIRPFAHTLPTFTGSYVSSSSDDTMSDAPPPSELPRKPARIAKQDKGIKCDHCGVDKTPLWRKVPNKENAYHWYPIIVISANLVMHVDCIINRMVIFGP